MNDDMGRLETMSVCCEASLLRRQFESGTAGNYVTASRNARPLERKPKQNKKQTAEQQHRVLFSDCLTVEAFANLGCYTKYLGQGRIKLFGAPRQ